MLSQIYSPYAGITVNPVKPAQNSPRPVQQPGTELPGETPEEQSRSLFDSRQQSRGLMTLETASQAPSQKIKMAAVLQDFKSTMTALGTPPEIQAEVETYLNAICLQAQKTSPSVPYIKQSLKTAADVLDIHIAQTLGQPSHVVQDWVDALLLQPLDYKLERKPEFILPASLQSAEDNNQEASANDLAKDLKPALETNLEETNAGNASTGLLTLAEKADLTKRIQAAKQAMRNQQWQNAEGIIQGVLPGLADKQRPDLEGKLYHLLGRIDEEMLKPQQALENYQLADQKFQKAGLVHKQGGVQYAMATLYDQLGQSDQAQQYYEQSLQLEKTFGQSRLAPEILNDLGSLALRQGDSAKAVTYFQGALQETVKPVGDQTLLAGIYHNLGTSYQTQGRYRQAAETFKCSLDIAFQAGDKAGYVSTLNSLGQVYVQAGKNDKAVEIFDRVKSLQGDTTRTAGL